LVASVDPTHAETALRIASWNIANLYEKAGEELRPGIGTRRQEQDFEALKRYADALDADIVLLQEIGTPDAARRLFPENTYDIRMSSRYAEDIEAKKNENDIYTAIAVRKRDEIKVLGQRDIAGLQIINPEDGRYTRRGTALRLEVNGTEMWVVSVHLKSSCSGVKSLDVSAKIDCQILWQQRTPLDSFIDERVADETAFVIGGDFNRRFRQFQFSDDPLWLALNDGNIDEPRLIAEPQTTTRKCPTRLGLTTQPIDWFLLDARIAEWFVDGSFWETRYSYADVQNAGGKASDRLSDHCPIKMDLILP